MCHMHHCVGTEMFYSFFTWKSVSPPFQLTEELAMKNFSLSVSSRPFWRPSDEDTCETCIVQTSVFIEDSTDALTFGPEAASECSMPEILRRAAMRLLMPSDSSLCTTDICNMVKHDVD